MMKPVFRTTAMALLAASSLLGAHAAMAEDGAIKIGIMADQSGPYADNGGPGSAEAARMAIEDAGGQVLGRKIELLVADDQNKPDVGVAVARKWLDQDGVDAIVGGFRILHCVGRAEADGRAQEALHARRHRFVVADQ